MNNSKKKKASTFLGLPKKKLIDLYDLAEELFAEGKEDKEIREIISYQFPFEKKKLSKAVEFVKDCYKLPTDVVEGLFDEIGDLIEKGGIATDNAINLVIKKGYSRDFSALFVEYIILSNESLEAYQNSLLLLGVGLQNIGYSDNDLIKTLNEMGNDNALVEALLPAIDNFEFYLLPLLETLITEYNKSELLREMGRLGLKRYHAEFLISEIKKAWKSELLKIVRIATYLNNSISDLRNELIQQGLSKNFLNDELNSVFKSDQFHLKKVTPFTPSEAYSRRMDKYFQQVTSLEIDPLEILSIIRDSELLDQIKERSLSKEFIKLKKKMYQKIFWNPSSINQFFHFLIKNTDCTAIEAKQYLKEAKGDFEVILGKALPFSLPQISLDSTFIVTGSKIKPKNGNTTFNHPDVFKWVQIQFKNNKTPTEVFESLKQFGFSSQDAKTILQSQYRFSKE